MDSAEFNKKVWEASIKAQFELAGIRDFDPNTQAFLIPSGSVQNAFPGLTSQNPTATELASFNAQLYQLADQMPLATAAQWAPATNRRYANYGTYLDYADPGANGAGAYRVVYQNAQAAYSNELLVWTPIKKAAQAAYASSGSPKTFANWVKNDYGDSDTYLNEQSTIGKLKSALDTASNEFYGPLWNTLNQDRQNWDLGQQAYMSSDTLGYNMDCGSAGINPAYDIDRKDWATTYLGWLAKGTASPPPKPSASATYTIDSDSTTDLSSYGIESTKVEAAAWFDTPFMFWGEGAYESTTERQSMYQKINFNNAKITMTSLTQPVSYPITPGKWYSSDLRTTFPNLISGAPSDPATLMYPYAATVVLAYNVGYQVSLESSVYQSLKTTVTTDTKAEAVVGFFGWMFGEVGTTYNNRTVSSLSQLNFDDTSNTVTISPDNNGVATILGVIVGKAPGVGLKSSIPRGLPVPNTQVQPSRQGSSTAFALLSATKAFISDLNSFVESLDRQRRATFVSAIKTVLRTGNVKEDFAPLISAIEDITSLDRQEDQEANEISLEQLFRNSSLTITVRNTMGGLLADRHNPPSLVFSDDAQQIVDLLDGKGESGKDGNNYITMASLAILQALASLAHVKLSTNAADKLSLIPDLVHELILHSISSMSSISDASTVAGNDNDVKDGTKAIENTPAPGSAHAVLFSPPYRTWATLSPDDGGTRDRNGILWSNRNSQPNVSLDGNTTYQVDLFGVPQYLPRSPVMTADVTVYNNMANWHSTEPVQYDPHDHHPYFTFTTDFWPHVGTFNVALRYTVPTVAPGGKLNAVQEPANPFVWKMYAH